MARKRKEVTYNDAEKYLKLIEQRFAPFAEDVFDMYGNPRIVEAWDGEHIAICWDGPYEWSYYATMGSFDYEERHPEYGIRLPKVDIPASLKHIFSEPYNAGVLILYLEG